MITSVDKLEEALTIINAGLHYRNTASQKLNSTSSRSHLVLTFYLEREVKEYPGGPVTGKVLSEMVFVDLAGNERVG